MTLDAEQRKQLRRSCELIVTGFSGVVVPTAPPVGSDPLDYTFIDPAGHSMVIQSLEPDGPRQ